MCRGVSCFRIQQVNVNVHFLNNRGIGSSRNSACVLQIWQRTGAALPCGRFGFLTEPVFIQSRRCGWKWSCMGTLSGSTIAFLIQSVDHSLSTRLILIQSLNPTNLKHCHLLLARRSLNTIPCKSWTHRSENRQSSFAKALLSRIKPACTILFK